MQNNKKGDFSKISFVLQSKNLLSSPQFYCLIRCSSISVNEKMAQKSTNGQALK